VHRLETQKVVDLPERPLFARMPAEDRVAAGRTPPSGRRSIANEFGSDLYSPLRASIAANRARCSSSVSDQTLTFASTARVGLPQLAIENCNRRRNLCSPRRLLIRHSFLERVHRLRGDFTSGGLRLGLRASIVSGRFGRPSGLPDTPGLKLVDLSLPLGIAWFCLFWGLFSS
jgi:hypothetical protein